jgi:hypothetical protein
MLGYTAMGVEFGIVRTHVHTSHLRHVHILEVLHGVLYPEAHGNGLKTKKKKKKCAKLIDILSILSFYFEIEDSTYYVML